MTDNEKIKLAINAIRTYNSEHYGWGGKFRTEEKEKYDALVEVVNMLKKHGEQMMKERTK